MDRLGHVEVMGALTVIHLKFVVLGNELLECLKFLKAEVSYRVLCSVVVNCEVMLREIPLSALIHTVG